METVQKLIYYYVDRRWVLRAAAAMVGLTEFEARDLLIEAGVDVTTVTRRNHDLNSYHPHPDELPVSLPGTRELPNYDIYDNDSGVQSQPQGFPWFIGARGRKHK